MKQQTKVLLKEFLEGIPPLKRLFNPDINHPNDIKRLLKVSVSLLENNDSIDDGEIKSICEEIGEEYTKLIETENFKDLFERPILSEIDKIKYIIETYKKIINE